MQSKGTDTSKGTGRGTGKSAGAGRVTESWEGLVSASAIASLLDMSAQNVRDLTRDGILTAVKRGDHLRYDRGTVTTQYIRYLRTQLNAKQRTETAVQTEERKRIADADWKRSRADMAALQLAELRGKLHRSEDVEAVTSDMVLAMRAQLTALPGRLAMDVASAGSPAEASRIIRAEIDGVLNAMADYKYDPGEYAKRARERAGWEGGESGDGEDGDDSDDGDDGEGA